MAAGSLSQVLSAKGVNMNEVSLWELFVEETREHLESMNQALLQLEKEPENLELINSIFRSVHTIKGSAAVMNYSKTVQFIHKIEDLIDLLREKKLALNQRIIQLLFTTCDFLQNFLSHVSNNGDENELQNESILQEVESILFIQSSLETAEEIYLIKLKLAPDCLLKTVRLWMIFEELDKVSSLISSSPPRPSEESFKDGSFNFEGEDVSLTVSSRESEQVLRNSIEKISEISSYSLRKLETAAGEITNNQEIQVHPQKEPSELVMAKDSVSSFIRIPESKIDYLVDLLGELIIFQSLHKQEIDMFLENKARGGSKLLNSIAKMERITKDLQNMAMSLRMVSLKQTLQKLQRVGRDTALKMGKTVNINLRGEDTEIDRSIVEKIQDPLMHLVRNAVSHGLEEDKERKIAGKEIPGQVTIQASNKRGSVYIEVSDDGQGLDLGKIYKKALHNGQITADREYSEEEISRLIFLPGLSTQEELNAVAGRGVGMNVVETEIKKLGGKIDILNRPGRGCSFILKIPINLAIINGLILKISEKRYIVPTVNIKHIFKPCLTDWVTVKGRVEYIKLREQLIKLIPPETFLKENCPPPAKENSTVIVLEMDNELRALPVTSILGKQEIVQKPLGDEFSGASIFSGGTILGDGKVCLILDIEALFGYKDK
jgi:two-component system chemotaxis sensor kinase CheA